MAQDVGDARVAEVHNLAAAATTLLERATAAPAGRATLTLVAGPGAALKQTLLALSGPAVGRTRRPWAATLQVLQDRVRLVTSKASWDGGQGDHLQIPSTRHRFRAWRTLASC